MPLTNVSKDLIPSVLQYLDLNSMIYTAQSSRFFKSSVYHYINSKKPNSVFKKELQQAILNYLLEKNLPNSEESKDLPNCLRKNLTEKGPKGIWEFFSHTKNRVSGHGKTGRLRAFFIVKWISFFKDDQILANWVFQCCLKNVDNVISTQLYIFPVLCKFLGINDHDIENNKEKYTKSFQSDPYGAAAVMSVVSNFIEKEEILIKAMRDLIGNKLKSLQRLNEIENIIPETNLLI